MHELVLVYREYRKGPAFNPFLCQKSYQFTANRIYSERLLKYFLTGTLDDFYEEVVHYLM
jgi:hypothetical protein